MPVKLGSKLPSESAEARIEIVPLIDIMFFLLAAFMLVSLSMVNVKAIKVNLPTASSSQTDSKKDIVDISIDQTGLIFLDKQSMDDRSIVTRLTTARQSNPDVRVFISGDRDARHGVVIHALDLVGEAGIKKVAFEIGSNQKIAHP